MAGPGIVSALLFVALVGGLLDGTSARCAHAEGTSRAPLDPAARLLDDDEATEYWTLFIDLESGHRITQRFLLTNAGPGRHTAVAMGHLIERGRPPYRYENGRLRPRWTLSPDRLFFDIASSHLDLHRPRGELRISKKDVQIQLFFDFPDDAPAAPVPSARLPEHYSIDVLAVGAATRGSVRGPWMAEPVETRGRTWLVHTWTSRAESEAIRRRIEIFGASAGEVFYGLRIGQGDEQDRSWQLRATDPGGMIESRIHIPTRWTQSVGPSAGQGPSVGHAIPERFSLSSGSSSGSPKGRDMGQITLESEWLRFDPLDAVPQPFRWFFRRTMQPLEVWADARIEGTLSSVPVGPPLPNAGRRVSEISSNSYRDTEDEAAERSTRGVAFITFLNAIETR